MIFKDVWLFVQNQLLGMKWLYELLKSFFESMGLDTGSRTGGSIHFFVYDIIKISFLLCLLIFIISYIQSYFPPERSRRILGRFKGIWANIISALLGTVTPFCSCSSIPLFMGFTGAGLPMGVTFSFLISSPMVDLGGLVLLMSIFGAKVAFIYVLLGLAVAVISGSIIEQLKMEEQIEEFIRNAPLVELEGPKLTRKDRLHIAKVKVQETLKKVYLYIIIGVFIGSIIHNWIPESFVQSILGSKNPLGVILAVIVSL